MLLRAKAEAALIAMLTIQNALRRAMRGCADECGF